MKRRSRAGASAKSRRGKAATLKGRDTPKALRNRGASVAGQETVVARLTHERDEALLRETANSEILHLISKSPGDLELVFRTILEHATRICNANFGNLFRFDGEKLHPAAQFNTPAALLETLTRRGPFKPTPGTSLDYVMRSKKVFHNADMTAEPVVGLATKLGGARSQVTIPMLKDDALIGAIVIYRQEVRPFTDKQIELLSNFAAQAVIAIENARLLSELRESLEQQTATADVLRIISSSPGELEPVFQAVLENAVNICEAKFANLFLTEGDAFRNVALYGAPRAFEEARRKQPLLKLSTGTALDRMAATKSVAQTLDAQADPSYRDDPQRALFLQQSGGRTVLCVPLMKEDDLVGGFSIYRQEVRPFTDQQIELLQNFAAQAVIAIENARLLSELRESLDQQTATADVLKVISSSPGELKPVFERILENATRICEAKFGVLCSYNGNLFKYAAVWNAPPAFVDFMLQRGSFAPRAGTPLDRILKTKDIIHRADASVDEVLTDTVRLAGAKSHLTVPMFKDEALVGVIIIYRQEVRPFSDKQIELVKNFAAQAVIAIENARLLSELRESLDRQTATSEILRVISSSRGDVGPVFQTILQNAMQICEAKFGMFFRYDGGAFHTAAALGVPPDYAEYLRGRAHLLSEHPHNPLTRVASTKAMLLVPDAREYQAYIERNPRMVALVELAGARTLVTLPMLKDGDLIGAMTIYRQEVRPFTDKQIELLQNFAAQAVIAIENARLLNELRQRTTDLSESLEQQTATSEVLKVISSAPGELDAVFEAILSNATRICEATYGNLLLRENGAFRRAAQCNAPQELIDEFQRNPVFVPLPNNPLDRVLKTKETVHTVDAQAASNLGSLADARTLLNVPMLSHDELIGAISIYRQEVRPFTEKQIALMQNFAAQAVIAIENARLLNELRDSLGRQTATSEVLSVISSSRGDLAPVFHAILENATRICEATFGSMLLRDGDAFRRAALHNAPPQFEEFIKNAPILRRGMAPSVDHAIDTRQVSHTLDAAAEEPNAPIARYGGARTLLDVPMLKGDEAIGILGIYRREVRPFTDRQIELVTNFAAQAVIAIENARLLSELRERTDEVLKLNEQLEARVADQVGEIERMGRLRRFLPPQVADLIVASGAERQLESHRREITALFCDLRGFTGFSESSDPEDVMTLLRQYHEAIGTIIITYSGTLERYAGDGVMVVFNDPVPVDNPALQAVRMALDMRAALSALIEKWRRLGHELGFGIGIAHGYATLGTIGFEGRFDYAAIGTVSNVASRLCDEAKPGQILISPRVLMAVEDAISVEPVGDFSLKGISRPLAAYNVVGVK